MTGPLYPAPLPGLEPCWGIFEGDPLLYLDLTEAVARGEGQVLYASPAGALVGFSDRDGSGTHTGYTMTAKDPDTASLLCTLLPRTIPLLTVHEDFYAPLLREKLGLILGEGCFQAAFPGRAPLPLPQTPYTVAPLTRQHLGAVQAHYHLGSGEYMQWLVDHGRLFGAFDAGTLMGFVGVHAEGSMGLLEVFPPYRRRGVAGLLQCWLTNRELSLGHIPYGQVFRSNTPSLTLQHKMGFSLSRGQLFWGSGDGE